MPSKTASSVAQPLVSVIIATRNRVQQLSECLQAVAAQTYERLEVIVADDGSDEITRASYASLCPALDSRLRWLLPEYPEAPGTGPAAARNRGVRAATGTFLTFCDDDDRWIRPDHIATAVRALEQTGADFYFTNVIGTRNGAESRDFKFFPEMEQLLQGTPVLHDPVVFAPSLPTVMRVVAGSLIHPDVWIVRKQVLAEAGEFWERLTFAEDYDMMMRVLDRSRVILFRPDPCAEYRLPAGDSVSIRTSNSDQVLLELLAAQHARLTCVTPLLRRHARAREAWILRQLAGHLRTEGRFAEARRFAWQGLVIYPTLGAVRDAILRR